GAQLKTDTLRLFIERRLEVQQTLVDGPQFFNVQCTVIHSLPDSVILKQGKALHGRDEHIVIEMRSLQVFYCNRAEEITVERRDTKRFRIAILKELESLQ